jgi:uncharacterized integral membrane protein
MGAPVVTYLCGTRSVVLRPSTARHASARVRIAWCRRRVSAATVRVKTGRTMMAIVGGPSQSHEEDLGSGSGRAQSSESRQEDAKHMRRIARARQVRLAKSIFALVIIVGLIVFVLQNAEPVPIRFFVTTAHPRLIWVLVGCAVLGGMAGYLVGRPGRRTRLHGKESSGERPPHA